MTTEKKYNIKIILHLVLVTIVVAAISTGFMTALGWLLNYTTPVLAYYIVVGLTIGAMSLVSMFTYSMLKK